jgi:uracil-DNA glycosylase family 4
VGNGAANAKIMLVLDSPTEADVASGGFLLGGDSSDLLTDLLEAARIPKEDVFVTAAVSCRPYTVVPATETEPEREVDRIPEKDELELCGVRLRELVYAVDPRIIVTMGDAPWKTLVLRNERQTSGDLSSACGNLYSTKITGRKGYTLTYPVMASYSIRQINTNPNSATKGPLNATIAALAKARRYVQWVLSKELNA